MRLPDDPGVAPIPARLRRLGAIDNAILWSSLSVGLLVLVTGSYLVPGLGLLQALAAIAVGSAIGGAVLGAIAFLAARTHVPGMVLLRGPLGVRGSYVATAVNVAQNVGWTVFEVLVIALAAHTAVGGSRALWTVFASVLVTALALGGPLLVVRRVLRAIALPVVLVTGIYLTIWAATRLHWPAARRGDGSLDFWQGVDLAVALPISWAPLVADYARFARSPAAALAGTAIGSVAANAWFYTLGALLALAGAADASIGITRPASMLVLALLALAECDKPFADLYSTVVSIQSLRPGWPAAPLAVALGSGVGAAALLISFTRYESFLYLLGALFVPLAGVLLAHAIRLRRYVVDDLYDVDGAYGSVNAGSLIAWLAGFTLYEWIAPSSVYDVHRALAWIADSAGVSLAPHGLARYGASLPSFVAAAGIAFVLTRVPAVAPEPSPGSRGVELTTEAEGG